MDWLNITRRPDDIRTGPGHEPVSRNIQQGKAALNTAFQLVGGWHARDVQGRAVVFLPCPTACMMTRSAALQLQVNGGHTDASATLLPAATAQST